MNIENNSVMCLSDKENFNISIIFNSVFFIKICAGSSPSFKQRKAQVIGVYMSRLPARCFVGSLW